MTEGSQGQSNESQEHTFRTRYTADEPTTVTVIKALAAIEGVHPASLNPLFDDVDPDALDDLFDTPVVRDGAVTAVFTASGYRVTVRSNGNITIRQADGRE